MTLTREQKENFMKEAIKEARHAEEIGEVPIGAVVVFDGQIIGRGYNRREIDQQATAHAEMMAIQEANMKLGNWRLENCQLFVTLEPCPMCSGAIILSRIEEVYYGPSDPKGGAAGTLFNLLEDKRFNHQSYVEKGVLEKESSELLKSFFKKLRENKKKNRKH